MASGSVFQLLVITSICPEAVRTYDVGASSSNITIALPGMLPADAQRRKYVILLYHMCVVCILHVYICLRWSSNNVTTPAKFNHVSTKITDFVLS